MAKEKVVKKIPEVNCSFEYKRIKSIYDLDLDGNLKTEWESLNYYYLYIFRKKGSEFMLCWKNTEEPAKPLELSVYTGPVLCDFNFKRGYNYYLYFSGKKLNSPEIDLVKNNSSNQFVEIIANKHGRIKINNSFFVWKYMVNPLMQYYPVTIDLINVIIDIYEKEVGDLDITGVDSSYENNIRWIKFNQFLILPDGKIFDIYYLLYGLKTYIEGKNLKWHELLMEIDNRTKDLYEKIDDTSINKNFVYKDLWAKTVKKYVPSIKMVGAIYGSILGSQKYEQLSNQTGYLLFNLLDEFFNTIDAAMQIFKEEIRYAENGIVVEKFKDGTVKRIIEVTTDDIRYTTEFEENGRKKYVLEEKINGNSSKKVKETFIEKSKDQKINYFNIYGTNIYKIEFYEYNSSSGEIALTSTDQWMVNSAGHVIVDYKQFFPKTVGSIIMNNHRRRIITLNGEQISQWDVHNEHNYFRKSGCVLTSIAIVDTFFKNENGKNQFTIDEYIDENNLWLNNISVVDFKVLVATGTPNLGYLYYELLLNNNKDELIQQIKSNIINNTPTFIRIANQHTAVIGGTRKDSSGNITDFLVRDPGSSRESRKYINAESLSNERGNITRIRWITPRSQV